MFRKLYLKNFKVWGEQLWDNGVELAPVTLLLGTNSAGKTSLLQALLLLKQTFQSPDPNLDLNLGGQPGDIADFGVFKDIVHGHTKSSEIGLGVHYTRDDEFLDRSDTIDYRATFASRGGIPVVTKVVLERSREGRALPENATFSLTRGAGGGYVLDAKVNDSKSGEDLGPSVYTSKPSRKHRPERSLFFPWSAVLKLKGSRPIVHRASNSLLSIFRRTYYLGPLRDYPKRTYLWSRQRPGEIGPRGEQAVAAILASTKESRSSRGKASVSEDPPIVQQVSRWLRKLNVADSLELKRQGQSRFYDVIIKRDGKSASLVDVGFGVSQVLPMIVMAYFVPTGSIIIAEQPEIHLHPLAQSALADLMVEVARERRIQFIVETHSEHMFRRLQSLIAEDQVTRDECRLYFAKRDESGDAILEQLRADPYGKIENWPKNFFGDAIGETERQMRRMIERMKQERGGAGNA